MGDKKKIIEVRDDNGNLLYTTSDEDPEELVKNMFEQASGKDKNLKKLLEQRMKRNKEMGFEPSPDDTSIRYGNGDPEFFTDNTMGYVKSDNPKEIVMNPSLKKNEDATKYTMAHELQHVNQFDSKSKDLHENPFPTRGNRLGNEQHEKRRVMRSLMHPYHMRQTSRNTNEFDFDVEKVIKYAKEQGIPVDEIIDAMTTNYAIASDDEAMQAHNKTRENQEVGRGFLGKLGLEKPLSSQEVYKPWKEMKEKRKDKKNSK